MIADLHMHTISSDGSMTPRALIKLCGRLKLNLISVTDHDNVSGVSEAIEAGKECGVRVIPGIELSSFRDGEVHIHGYNVDYINQAFIKELDNIQLRREERNLKIVRKLYDNGIVIDYIQLKKKRGVLGRLHIANEMVKNGYVQSVSEAFDKYIGFGKSCYEEAPPLISPERAIELITLFGGTPVLAHPYRYVEEGNLREFVMSLPGLKGLEVWYPLHTESIRRELLAIAEEFNLIVTGGSDFHRPESGNPLGSGNYDMDDLTASVLKI
jgi:predicted metal-dependent phosphoesterase TrpH